MGISSFSVQMEGGIKIAECNDVPQLMVIAGPNGVGKSTLLESINTNTNKHDHQIRNSQNSIKATPNIETIYFSPHRAPNPSTISASALLSLSNKSSRSLLGDQNYQVDSRDNSLPSALRGQHNRSRQRVDFAPYFEVKKRLSQFEYQKGDILSQVYEEKGEVPTGYIPDLNQPLKSGIESVLPGIKYKGVKSNNENEYEVMFENRNGENINYDQLSSGERDAIAMIFLLLEKRIENLMSEVRGSASKEEDLVVLIDSPESHLHPAMQERFFNYLQDVLESSESDNLNLQVILCTHSKMILNNAHMENIYLLMYSDQRPDNQLVHADKVERSVLDEFLGDLGISALSAGKPLLLVEGKTDKDILTRMCPEVDVHFEMIPMGGKGKVQDADATFSELSSELSNVNISVYGLVDRDREDSGNTSGPFYTLSKTCIENFLLDEEVLYDALTTLAAIEDLNRIPIRDPQDAEEFIHDIIRRDEFRSSEIKARLNENLRFYVNLRDLDEMTLEEVEQEIDDVVDTKKDRIESQLQDAKDSVDDAIASNSTGDLNGKIIYTHIASELGLSAEPLKRTAAEKINEKYGIPPGLANVLSDLFNSVSQPYSVESE